MSSLQDKMYKYEQTPPAKVWEKIAAALDESNLSDEFPSKLYNTEVTPPSTVWDEIKASLEAEPGNPAPAPVKRPFVPLFRYTAAAIIIGIIAFSIIKLTAGDSAESATKKIAGIEDSTRDNRTVNDDKAAEDDSVKEEAGQEMAVTDLPRTPKPKKVKRNYAIRDDMDGMEAIYAFNEHTPDLADRYIMLMTPNGNIIRMSKKWGDFICCVSGEEQDNDCKDQLKKLQEKLATSPATSPGNFMDILSLVSSLSEDEL